MSRAILKAREYIGTLTAEELAADDMRLDAVIRHRTIVCEVAKEHLPTDLIARHPDLPWREIAGMGDILRHHYHGIDIDGLVATVQDRKNFEQRLEVIAAELPPQS